MVASPAQIDANRRNAQLSTGPKTIEGKQQSRANAVTHGSSNVGPVNRELVNPELERLLRQFHEEHEPRGIEETTLVAIMARSAYGQSFWGHEEFRLSEIAARDDEVAFESRRRAEAARRIRRLSHDPEYTVAYLKTSAPGIEVLLGRWNELLGRVQQTGDLDDKEQRMLEDLLGLHPDLRPATYILDTISGDDKKAKYIRLITAEIAKLEPERAQLAVMLAQEFVLLKQGAFVEEPPTLRRARRYQSEAFRQFKWAYERLLAIRSGTARPLAVKPVWVQRYEEIGFVSENPEGAVAEDSSAPAAALDNPPEAPAEAPPEVAPTPLADVPPATVEESTTSPQVEATKAITEVPEKPKTTHVSLKGLSRREWKKILAQEYRVEKEARMAAIAARKAAAVH